VIGKVFGVSVGAFLTGNGMRTSVQAGMSLAQIGEFSFIIAALGLSLNATSEFLYPVAVAVSAVTTLSTPWLIRASQPVAKWMDRKLPKPLQTFSTLYGSWVEDLRAAPRAPTTAAGIRRLLRLLVLDAGIIAIIIVATSTAMGRIVAWAQVTMGLSGLVARLLVIGAALALSARFCIGVFRVSQKLGVTFARLALPAEKGKRVDFAAAPRRMLMVTLQLSVVLLVGVPLLALTQPFLPDAVGAPVLGLLVAVLGIAFWRTAANLQGHVRAGAQVILETLAAQSHDSTKHVEGDVLARVQQVLPGLGALTAVQLDSTSQATGRSLAELNLRGLTGATVLAITRDEGGVIIPTAEERLHEGDVLALAGSHEAIEAARKLLTA
jgi:CPA2 family monovalent cation:H+ antiporter-2